MKTETVALSVVRYMDADGNPTCATDFSAGLVCMFYTTQRYGCHETCLFAAHGQDRGPRGLWPTMRRRNKGSGTLIPLAACPLWSDAALARA